MASNHSDTDSDTEVDAQPESRDDQSVHNHECSARNQQQATAHMSSTAHDDIIDEHIKQFNYYLPPELKDDRIEVLIINTKPDYNQAKALEEHIMKNVKFGNSLNLTPNVVLLDSVITDLPCDHLDYAYSISTIILLYVTKSFCNEWLYKSQSYACLNRILQSSDKKKTIIVVHTDEKRDHYTLPMMLDSLPTLDEFSVYFLQELSTHVDKNSSIILERRKSLKDKRWGVIKPFIDNLNLSKCPVSNLNSKKKNNSKSAHTGIEQQVSQVSLSTQPKSVPVQGDVEPDGDVSGRRSKPQQNIEQRNSRPHSSKVGTNERAHESGCNSLAGEEPSLNNSSLQECDGDKTVPTNLPAHVGRTHPQTASSDALGDKMQPQPNNGPDALGDRMQPQPNNGPDALGDRMQPQPNNGPDALGDRMQPQPNNGPDALGDRMQPQPNNGPDALGDRMQPQPNNGPVALGDRMQPRPNIESGTPDLLCDSGYFPPSMTTSTVSLNTGDDFDIVTG